MKKRKQLIMTIILFLFTAISVYLIVEKNKSKFPDNATYIYSH